MKGDFFLPLNQRGRDSAVTEEALVRLGRLLLRKKFVLHIVWPREGAAAAFSEDSIKTRMHQTRKKSRMSRSHCHFFYPPLAPCDLVPSSSTTSSSLHLLLGTSLEATYVRAREPTVEGRREMGKSGLLPGAKGRRRRRRRCHLQISLLLLLLLRPSFIHYLTWRREEGGAPRAKVGPKICLMPPMRGEGRECLNFGHMIMTMMGIQELSTFRHAC